MVKRTAEISPNSERAKNKFKEAPTGGPDPTNAPPPSKPSSSNAPPPPNSTPSTSKPNQPTVIQTSTPRYEKTNGTLNTSMRSTPDQSPEITRHTAFVSKPLEVIVLEIYKKDDQPFDGLLPRDTLKLLWSELGRNIEEIKILKRERLLRKGLKVTFILRSEVPLLEVSQTYEILIELKLGSKTHVFGARFPQFREIVCELGQLVTVTFCDIPSHVDCEDLREWIEVFGAIKSKFRYRKSH
jgi:hypothetical protein